MTSRTGSVDIEGSGTVRAKGKIDELEISIAGSGKADFGQVESRTAKSGNRRPWRYR